MKRYRISPSRPRCQHPAHCKIRRPVRSFHAVHSRLFLSLYRHKPILCHTLSRRVYHHQQSFIIEHFLEMGRKEILVRRTPRKSTADVIENTAFHICRSVFSTICMASDFRHITGMIPQEILFACKDIYKISYLLRRIIISRDMQMGTAAVFETASTFIMLQEI